MTPRPHPEAARLGKRILAPLRRAAGSRPILAIAVLVIVVCTVSLLSVLSMLSSWTQSHLIAPPVELPPGSSAPIEYPQFVDRQGQPLSITFRNRWNATDFVPFHALPELLVAAVVAAEDQRFFDHSGIDWLARAHATTQNLRAGRIVRGASTITEQAVRILHPRPRTARSRWFESFEARALEERFSKTQILELYLNQVPYARQLRGVGQAARAYFGRGIDTLTAKETLALAVLVRSPSRLDLAHGTEEIERPLVVLAERLHRSGIIDDTELEEIRSRPLEISPPLPPIEATHFVRFVRDRLPRNEPRPSRSIRTTLDSRLQHQFQRLLDERLEHLASRRVGTGAALVVDLETGEILAWVNAGGLDEHTDGAHIDKVLTPRQPGSALKPFIYAMAMEKGWSAATLVDDAPLADPIGHGLHQFRNYSRTFYGPVRVREALGNSLNTPAVRAARFVGSLDTLSQLRSLGFHGLDRHPDVYGDGLALGTGEVSLFDLVRAYATLANRGAPLRLSPLIDSASSTNEPANGASDPAAIISPEVAAIITDILADPEARSREFGRGSVLAMPQPTAVKTGTSNDYRDAWSVGYTSRWLVGVWMGNIDRQPMLEVTGSRGPALVMRSIFAELERYRPSQSFTLDRTLKHQQICRDSGLVPTSSCPLTVEWFRTENAPRRACHLHGVAMGPRPPADSRVRLESPTPGLHLAMDPRIPDRLEAFPFRLETSQPLARVEWLVDDAVIATTTDSTYLWFLARGHHTAQARVWPAGGGPPGETQTVGFLVK